MKSPGKLYHYPNLSLTIALVLLLQVSSSKIGYHPHSKTNLPTYEVPTFTFSDLQDGTRDGDLEDTLTSTGLLAIRVRIPENNQGFYDFEGLCHCRNNIGPHIPGADRIILDDGVTTRSTIATATMGTEQPLALPQQEITKSCGLEYGNVHSNLEDARDLVSNTASKAFVPALDRLINERTQDQDNDKHYVLSLKSGGKYHSIKSVVDDAVHLEHFHVYDKAENSDETQTKQENKEMATPVDKALDWHTDAGLFLAFLPGKRCNLQSSDTNINNVDQDDSFHVMVPSSTSSSSSEMRAKFPQAKSGEIIVAIMLGTGAEHWLELSKNYDLQLRATKHAVKMRTGQARVWYGMMYLVSSQAIVQTKPTSLTFSEMRNSIAAHRSNRSYSDTPFTQNEGVAIGCGSISSNDQKHVLPPVIVDRSINASSRRRLQHGVDPSDCSNSADGRDFYCWMQCPILKGDDLPVQDHLIKGESLYCAHLAVLAQTKNLKKAILACTDEKGVIGGIMDDGCSNIWHPTIEGAFTYLQDSSNIPTETDSHADNHGESGNNEDIVPLDQNNDLVNKFHEEKYCYGSTAMYMQGFEWEGTTCVVYLFKSLVITTRAVFVIACIFTVVFGIAVEIIIKQRSLFVERLSEPKQKLLVSAFLYAIQLISGYFIMLVVMTYSAPLVISVVVGLTAGHVFVNLDAIRGGNKGIKLHTSGGTTPCCVTEKEVSSEEPLASGESPKEETQREIEDANCGNCCDPYYEP